MADDRLRLRWSGGDAQGKSKRFSMPFGAVNATNRIAAERLAREIELDIARRNFDSFDPSLCKYKRDLAWEDGMSAKDLVARFTNNQISHLQSSSLERYSALQNHLVKFFPGLAVDGIRLHLLHLRNDRAVYLWCIVLRKHIKTMFENSIDTIAKGITLIPALPHPILQAIPPRLDRV